MKFTDHLHQPVSVCEFLEFTVIDIPCIIILYKNDEDVKKYFLIWVMCMSHLFSASGPFLQ